MGQEVLYSYGLNSYGLSSYGLTASWAKSSYDPGWMDMCIDMCRLVKKKQCTLDAGRFLGARLGQRKHNIPQLDDHIGSERHERHNGEDTRRVVRRLTYRPSEWPSGQVA